MTTKDLKKKFPDLCTATITLNAVYSRRYVEDLIKRSFGNNVIRYEHSGNKIKVATSVTYGEFISQLKPGTYVYMNGDKVETKPEYKIRDWKILTFPQFMYGEMVIFLDGFSGAYPCEKLRLPVPSDDLPF